MSDREGEGFDVVELRALGAVLLGDAGLVAPQALGQAGLYAHVLWRRRQGSLAALPV